MNDKYPNLIETTTSWYTERTYMKGLGVRDADLTEEEMKVLERSERYVERYYAEENEKLLKLARADFEKLRDIPNMPDEALDILREWTTREEDEWDYDIDE
ncbi:MAG: hypothetical protein M0P29_13080 [Sphaerochaetaceae bacterium]|nr:hypothetical protein [Sphaerochaetaceae bacterium]